MTNAQLERIFEELRRRGALRALQTFLGSVDVPSARSWAELEERVRQAFADKSLDPGVFVDFFIQVQLTAYKAYRLYGLESKERKALIDHFAKVSKPNEFAQAYPYPVSQKALGLADDDPVPVSVQDTTSGTALIMCSPRRFFARSEIPSSYLDQSVRSQYRGARLFADEKGMFQAYDVIFVSKNDDYIQVRTDLGANRLEEDSNVLQATVTDALMDLVVEAGLADQPSPIELFGAVRKIYQAKSEGRVSEMYFDCSTGANRRETMRRRDAGDLRKERYHVAGKGALNGAISLYRLSVAWTPTDVGIAGDDEIEAELPGTLTMLNNGGGLFRCDLKGLPSEEQVEFMLGRVLHHA